MKFTSKLLNILLMENLSFVDPHLRKIILRNTYSKFIHKNRSQTNNVDLPFRRFRNFSKILILIFTTITFFQDVPRFILDFFKVSWPLQKEIKLVLGPVTGWSTNKPWNLEFRASRTMRSGFYYTNPKRENPIKPLHPILKYNFTIQWPEKVIIIIIFFPWCLMLDAWDLMLAHQPDPFLSSVAFLFVEPGRGHIAFLGARRFAPIVFLGGSIGAL